jgi:hypothetical protein
MLHPDTPNCFSAFIKFVADLWVKSTRVYGPVYIIPLILFRSGALLKTPLRTLWNTAFGISRSSLFLAMYCGMCWVSQRTAACCSLPFVLTLVGWCG